MKKVLVVAAHPDDEVLGVGGTIIKHIENGDKVHVLILCKPRSGENFELVTANEILKTTAVYSGGLVDQRLDCMPLSDIADIVSKIKNKILPDIVYTHSSKDLNQDHVLAYSATQIACRPLPGETVKEIYGFETLSSTEWPTSQAFTPNYYVDITDTFILKQRALECYQSELRDAPHPRGLTQIDIANRYRGLNVGVDYAEAFEVIRIIK